MEIRDKFRELHPGMGAAVAERTYLRRLEDGSWETWGDLSRRVALGNSLLCKNSTEQSEEFNLLNKHLSNGSVLMSGRHLQHGDEKQPTRNQEVFVNCATAATSFSLFYLLLNGSGVGRCYDDDIMLVNWDHAPNIRCVLDHNHKDFDWSAHESVRDAQHKYANEDTFWFEVPDSREGWAKALEVWENSAFEKVHKDKILILDFSAVRPSGSPIGGMQQRPSSGPVPLMNAFHKASTLKGSKMPKWKQSMYVDHYFAECVLVGGARRAARMSTKFWKDKGVCDFIQVKRPVEFNGLDYEGVREYLQSNFQPMGFLWSSNNSVTVDKQFWDLVKMDHDHPKYGTTLANHARKVFKMMSECSYGDNTGEPGFINVDKLTVNKEGSEDILLNGTYIESEKYKTRLETSVFLNRISKKALDKKYPNIVNPCGEISLSLWSGFCVIGDVVPYHCDTIEEAEEAFRVTTRALIRTNTLDSIYNKEVARTNRIGVGITGIHEFAWKFFKYTFNDLVDEEKSQDFWLTLTKFSRAVYEESVSYSKELGLPTPHTCTTVKPSGSISKLFGLTEGWHLPAMKQYIRWVQFRNDDPLVESYKGMNYPTKELKQYEGTTIVGFPTQPVLANIMPEENIVTAGEASPEDQYKWLILGEKYWLKGNQTTIQYNNQISFTLKYDPAVVSLGEFQVLMKEYQSKIICCSIMPQHDVSAYEYQPEEPTTKAQYEAIAYAIQQAANEENGNLTEDIGMEHLDCEGGACPITFVEGNKSDL